MKRRWMMIMAVCSCIAEKDVWLFGCGFLPNFCLRYQPISRISKLSTQMLNDDLLCTHESIHLLCLCPNS